MKTSDLSRACLQAYVDKSREAAEALIADDFRFTSPLDNQLDRSTYFSRCWPNSESMRAATVIEAFDGTEQAVVIYEAQMDHKRFRNCELHRS
ncbi:MAG: nuclear transport factor 2 family protein, partial [Burkholderiaceae bacterium]